MGRKESAIERNNRKHTSCFEDFDSGAAFSFLLLLLFLLLLCPSLLCCSVLRIDRSGCSAGKGLMQFGARKENKEKSETEGPGTQQVKWSGLDPASKVEKLYGVFLSQ